MADTEEPIAPRSIKDRIAALNLQKADETPSSPPPSYEKVFPEKRKAPPPPLPKRAPASTNNPPVLSNGISSTKPIGNQPARETPSLPARPARRPTNDAGVPSLPPRRPSEQTSGRRPSLESVASTVSVRSTGSALSSRTSTSTNRPDGKPRMLAPEFDATSLPPLPQRKEKEDKANGAVRAPLRPTRSTPSAPQVEVKPSLPPLPSRSPAPPALPGRPALPSRPTALKQDEPTPAPSFLPPPAKREVKAPLPRRSALDFGMNKSSNESPPVPSSRPGAEIGAPPPVPTGSRPDLGALQASKPKPGTASSVPRPSNDCLVCRDFSAPDAHAARFPRQSVPSHDPAWLGRELTAPFPSHTDKARALFTWLHHNVAYDTVGFFSGNRKSQKASDVASSGLAVCEGYAGLFSAMALGSGLEAVTVGGHGKGYGHSALPEGAPIPPVGHNHAWNAVKIDGGVWKLIDCCWGAGHLDTNTRTYKQKFSAERFTQSNEEFGLDHWPQDQRHFYRSDGRVLSWEEYILQDAGPEKRMVYGNCSTEHGIRKSSVKPELKQIRLNDPLAPGPTVRFQMEKMCPHWRNEIHGAGKDMVFCLEIGGRDGRKGDKIPLETDGYFHWVDVMRTNLGAPGQKVRLIAITKINDKDGRGLTKSDFLSSVGRGSMAWGFVADWELVH